VNDERPTNEKRPVKDPVMRRLMTLPTAIQNKKSILTGLFVACVATVSGSAAAQGGFGGPGGFGDPSMSPARPKPTKPKEKEPPPGTPELHAASGGGESTLPQGSEPTLPEDPLAVSEAVAAQIGSNGSLDEPELGRGSETDRDYYGLYYQEQSDEYRLRLAFPLWMERTQPSLTDPSQPDRASLFGGIYYNRRSAERADDILFPLVWNLRDTESRTTIVGPFVNRSAKEEDDTWLAPLFFEGGRKDGGYTIIPPLLTYMNRDAEGGFNLFGPAFCSWTKGTGCFSGPETRDFGLFPLYFGGNDDSSSYRLIPPLLHYHEQDSNADSELDVWGPIYSSRTESDHAFHLLPFYWSFWGKEEHHTTLFPLFHYGWNRNASLFVNPLFLTATSEEGYETFATWGYARYRGRTELDMYTPLLWLYRDPDAGLSQQLLFPFLYHRSSPREESLAIFPLFGSFHRFGIERETWITPLFKHEQSLTGWQTNLYPLLFFGRDRHESHSVVAPIFWDFSGPSSRVTIAAPIYWRFASPNSLTQLVGNFLYTEKKVSHGLDWKFHILPAFTYGETPDGHSWDVLFGLVGFKRKADYTALKLFWIPITLSGTDPSAAK